MKTYSQSWPAHSKAQPLPGVKSHINLIFCPPFLQAVVQSGNATVVAIAFAAVITTGNRTFAISFAEVGSFWKAMLGPQGLRAWKLRNTLH